MSQAKPNTILIGAIAGAFGVHGEVRIKSFTGNPKDMMALAPFCDAKGQEILTLTSSRPVKDGIVVRSPQVKSREDAQALKSTKLYCLRSTLPKLDGDEFYHTDLVGLLARSADGAPLGQVKSVSNFGASDVLEICETPGFAEKWTIPFSLQYVPEIEIDLGFVVLANWQDYLPGSKKDDIAAQRAEQKGLQIGGAGQ